MQVWSQVTEITCVSYIPARDIKVRDYVGRYIDRE